MTTTAEQHYKKMTETPVVKLVVLLGIPTTVSMLITSVYNMVDTYFVGSLGESPQGAISILFTLQSIIQAVAFMLGHGSGTFVAKELANKDTDKASAYVSSAFFFGGVIGVVFALLGLAFLSPFMRLLGSTETILPYARDYGLWVLVSCPFMICSLVLNNNLRYEGKAFYAMIGLSVGAILNIGMDYIFVSICHLGVFGAGMATAISQTISFFILLVLYIKTAQSKIAFRYVSKKIKMYLEIFHNGLPSFIRQCLNSVSSGTLNHLAGFYGELAGKADAAINAMGVVNKVSNFAMCVGMGISQGLQPVASFNYQAKEYDRVKKAYKFTMLIAFACAAVIALPVCIFTQDIVVLFQKGENTVQIAVPAMRYAMIGIMFMPIFIPINILYQSIRKAGIASVLALLRSGLVFIPVLFLLTSLWQITGLQLAQPVSDVITALINIPFILYFFKSTPATPAKQIATDRATATQNTDGQTSAQTQDDNSDK